MVGSMGLSLELLSKAPKLSRLSLSLSLYLSLSLSRSLSLHDVCLVLLYESMYTCASMPTCLSVHSANLRSAGLVSCLRQLSRRAKLASDALAGTAVRS